MIKYEIEFYYNNVEIHILKQFGYSYHFYYGGVDYYPLHNYIDVDTAKMNAKLHVNQILSKRGFGDDLDMNV